MDYDMHMHRRIDVYSSNAMCTCNEHGYGHLASGHGSASCIMHDAAHHGAMANAGSSESGLELFSQFDIMWLSANDYMRP